jgi:serine/threonine protein kinase
LIDFNESLKYQPGEWLSMDDFEMKPEKALFVPPEAHNRGESTEKFDCWSIGMIAHILLTGSPPFDESFDPAKEMIDNHFEWTSKARVSSEAKDLVTKLLARFPEDRISAKEAMLHPLFQVL